MKVKKRLDVLLTEQGFAFLEEMERLHITADVSHLSDKGFWDIANHSTRPFAASHSNCRALSPRTYSTLSV